MKIDITKKEYRTLLEMVYIAKWMITAHQLDEQEDLTEYKQFAQKIYALAQKFGYQDLVEHAPEYEKFYPARVLEDDMHINKFIDKYDNDTFWSEILDRLVERDMLREIGKETLKSLDIMEYFSQREPYENKYDKEFEAHGIDRFGIKY